MQGAPLMSMGQGVADQLLPLLQLIAQYLPTSMGGGAPTMGSTTSQQVGPMPQSIMRADNPAVQAVNPPASGLKGRMGY